MQELRLIGVHEDGSHVLLADEAGVRYRLPLDERLRAAARRASAAAHTTGESSLTAREVQALIRAGHTAEEVAERAGWAVRKVAVFEAPVLAERGYVAGLAMNSRLRARTDAGDSELLGTRVERRLAGRGVSSEQAEWDATRPETGGWQVHVVFPAGGRERQASWSFDHATGQLEALDDEARWLSEDDGGPGTPPPPRVSGEMVYDVDAAGGVGGPGDEPTGPARGDQTDALMTAIREHSHAGDRRGTRRSRTRTKGETRPRSGVRAVPAPADAETEPADDPASMAGAQELPIEDLPEAAPLPRSAAVPPPARGTHPLDRPAPPADPPPGADPHPGADPGAGAEPDPDPGGDPAARAHPDAEREPGPGSQPAPEPEPGPDTDAVSQPEPEPDADQDTPAGGAAQPQPERRRSPRRRGRVGVPDWNDVMFGPSRDIPE